MLNPLGKGRLGILGGMGSEATAHFLRTLAQRASATVDQDHVPFVLLSCPEIPDRSSAVAAHDNAISEIIVARLRQLEEAGCVAVALPCNTAHFWRRNFAASLKIPFIDIISTTAKYAARSNAKTAVVLGTRSTIAYRLYDEALEECGITSISVDNQITLSTSSAIAFAKAGNLNRSWEQLAKALRESRALHPDIIILGCTELPMVLPLSARCPTLVDPVECLADECIHWWLNFKIHCIKETKNV